MHFSHVGACTGRDHFSGWSLDWINLALGYLPFLRRFYAPADARAAFLAVRDAAAEFGGHIVAIPRDNLPVLTQPGSQRAAVDGRRAVDGDHAATAQQPGAEVAVLAVGAPSYLAGAASDKAMRQWRRRRRLRHQWFPAGREASRRACGALQEDHHGRGRSDRNSGIRPARLRRLRVVGALRQQRRARSLRNRRSANRAVRSLLRGLGALRDHGRGDREEHSSVAGRGTPLKGVPAND